MTLAEYIESQRETIEESLKNGKDVVITFREGLKLAGFLKEFRKAFPNNYVDKEGSTYTICAGDKEFNKLMHKPIPMWTSKDAKKMFNKSLEELREAYED